MATWEDLSIDAFLAAQELFRAKRWRSSISRSYYAAYAAVTGDLADTVTFPRGRNNPPHEVLAALIDRNLPALSRDTRRRLKTAVRKLYDARTAADYLPRHSIEREEARRCLWDASYVLKCMKVHHD